MKKYAVICLAALLALACFLRVTGRAAAQAMPGTSGKPTTPSLTLPEIDKEKIRAHVKFLASDLLEGRGTGSRGGDVAAAYIATQFELSGLKPAGDNGTYFQDVPMVGVKTLPETSFNFVEATG